MQIYFKKTFLKQYKKLQKRHRENVDQAIERFKENPHDPSLKNHALVSKLLGKRSIVAGFDLRIIFEVEGDYITVIMLGVGSHNQVY